MRKFLEMEQLENIIQSVTEVGDVEILDKVVLERESFPIYKLTFGSKEPSAPVLGLVGGVHGLERIGTQVVLQMLKTFIELMLWDDMVRKALESVRVFFIPIVNPGGIFLKSRSNPKGVDIMRNSPVEALERPTFLLGCHRISSKLPWFRGAEKSLEIETAALLKGVQVETGFSSQVITIDFHSGFGTKDRLWFPYAKTSDPFPNVAHIMALTELLNRTYPHHIYTIEPQAKNYTTHGDIWDHLYDDYQLKGPSSGVFLPLCLEMGSWNWVRKNPIQIFRAEGVFHPMKAHRLQRTLRRHNTLFEFMLRAIASPRPWSDLSKSQINRFENQATQKWYTK